jgi:hypothetical protein
METYDPNSESTPITIVDGDVQIEEVKKTVPTGLLRPEKKVDDDQMADFSSPIEEVMPGPGQMMQNEVMGPPLGLSGNSPVPRSSKKKSSTPASANPFGLTDEQFYAALAGLAAIIAYSEPVQGKLSTMIPKFLAESGKHTMTGSVVTALVAALVFFVARKYVFEKH